MSSIYFIIVKGQWLSIFFIITRIQYILTYISGILSLISQSYLFPFLKNTGHNSQIDFIIHQWNLIYNLKILVNDKENFPSPNPTLGTWNVNTDILSVFKPPAFLVSPKSCYHNNCTSYKIIHPSILFSGNILSLWVMCQSTPIQLINYIQTTLICNSPLFFLSQLKSSWSNIVITSLKRHSVPLSLVQFIVLTL